jgi:hypothetical protein
MNYYGRRTNDPSKRLPLSVARSPVWEWIEGMIYKTQGMDHRVIRIKGGHLAGENLCKPSGKKNQRVLPYPPQFTRPTPHQKVATLAPIHDDIDTGVAVMIEDSDTIAGMWVLLKNLPHWSWKRVVVMTPGQHYPCKLVFEGKRSDGLILRRTEWLTKKSDARTSFPAEGRKLASLILEIGTHPPVCH